MYSIESPKKILIRKIKDAFNDVVLGDGIGFLESIVVDNYGSEGERSEVRKKDEKNDWKKLVSKSDMDESCCLGGLAFFDPKGFRFHIPAYMCTVILDNSKIDILEHVLFCLTSLDDYNMSRFRILNVEQRIAVRDFLYYIMKVDNENIDIFRKSIEESIKRYWGKC